MNQWKSHCSPVKFHGSTNEVDPSIIINADISNEVIQGENWHLHPKRQKKKNECLYQPLFYVKINSQFFLFFKKILLQDPKDISQPPVTEVIMTAVPAYGKKMNVE